MVDFSNLGDYLEDDRIALENIKSSAYPEGKTYYIESPDAKTGLRLAALGNVIIRAGNNLEIDKRDTDRLKLDDNEERELMDDLMGEVKDEMLEDGVKWVTLRGVTQYLFIYFAIGKERADAAAANGILSGKAQEPVNRAERRSKQKTRSGRPASTGSSKAKGKAKRKS